MEEIGIQLAELNVFLDSFNATIYLILGFAICGALAIWAFCQKKDLFPYLMVVPVALVYGLSLASSSENGSALWVGGVIIAIIGTACLFKAVMVGFEKVRARRRQG